MNNTLCLGIFAALVGFRDLTWQYSAEVTVILLIQVVMGVIALLSGFLNHHTYWVSRINRTEIILFLHLSSVYSFRYLDCFFSSR